MDKQKAELEKIENAQVSTVTDQNGLQAIKVTFDNGILFKLNSSTLNAVSKTALSQFAASLKNTPETDITIWGTYRQYRNFSRKRKDFRSKS